MIAAEVCERRVEREKKGQRVEDGTAEECEGKGMLWL